MVPSKPKSVSDLFMSFCKLSLKGFGGIFVFIEHMVVEEKKWLTREEFLADWAVAQTLPGPPALNLAIIIGNRTFGLWGAIASVCGLVIIPFFLVLVLVNLYEYVGNNVYVAGALQGMSAVAAGLFIAAGVKLAGSLKYNPLGWSLCAILGVLSFVGVVFLHIPLVLVLLSLGLISCSVAYMKLHKVENKT